MPDPTPPGDPTAPIIALDLFQDSGKTVRRIFVDGVWYYSVVDVVGLLADSTNASQYWTQMKRRMSAEGARQLLTKCKKLKLPAPDGKYRLTDCADMEALLRIIQSIPSPHAEPVKQWLARLGNDELTRMAREAALAGASEHELRVSIRDQVIEHNREMMDDARRHGVQTPRDFGRFQNAGYAGLYNGETEAMIHERKRLKRSQHILDWMGSAELAANLFRITQTQLMLGKGAPLTREQANKVHHNAGAEVRASMLRLSGIAPEDLPTPSLSVEQARKLVAQRQIQPPLFDDAPEA